jgi:hypothetical protein
MATAATVPPETSPEPSVVRRICPPAPCATRRSSTESAGINVSPIRLTSGTVRVTPSPDRPRLIVPSPAAADVSSGRLTTAAGNCASPGGSAPVTATPASGCGTSPSGPPATDRTTGRPAMAAAKTRSWGGRPRSGRTGGIPSRKRDQLSVMRSGEVRSGSAKSTSYPTAAAPCSNRRSVSAAR